MVDMKLEPHGHHGLQRLPPRAVGLPARFHFCTLVGETEHPTA